MRRYGRCVYSGCWVELRQTVQGAIGGAMLVLVSQAPPGDQSTHTHAPALLGLGFLGGIAAADPKLLFRSSLSSSSTHNNGTTRTTSRKPTPSKLNLCNFSPPGGSDVAQPCTSSQVRKTLPAMASSKVCSARRLGLHLASLPYWLAFRTQARTSFEPRR